MGQEAYFNYVDMFQTPSERGGIVLSDPRLRNHRGGQRFKPLQNGAVLC